MILRAENIMKIYGSRKVVTGISLQVQQGGVHQLAGRRAGKEQLIDIIVGMIKPNEGKIFLDDEDYQNSMYKEHRKVLVTWLQRLPFSETFCRGQHHVHPGIYQLEQSRSNNQWRTFQRLGLVRLRKTGETCCQVEKGDVLRSRAHWHPIRNLFYSMNPLPELTPSL